jgi:hypothetical protein
MDISVSGLNGRLASRLPPELPLGLVFVVGRVERVGSKGFILAEGSHHLYCQTDENGQSQIGQGDEVRASGHLMFDAEQLRYYLLARDIEIVTSEPLGVSDHSPRELLVESEDLLSALAAVKARAAVAPTQAGENLPVWVRKLAPPEVQTAEIENETVEVVHSRAPKTELDEDLISKLSEAMDSEDELELTPEFLSKYIPEEPEPPEPLMMDTAVPLEQSTVQKTEEPLAELATSYRPVSRQDTDWLVILLIISFFVLTIAAIVAIVLLVI